jgi:hypothetical protein
MLQQVQAEMVIGLTIAVSQTAGTYSTYKVERERERDRERERERASLSICRSHVTSLYAI